MEVRRKLVCSEIIHRTFFISRYLLLLTLFYMTLAKDISSWPTIFRELDDNEVGTSQVKKNKSQITERISWRAIETA